MTKMHPFLIFSYVIKVALKLIPPYLLVLILRSSIGLDKFNEELSLVIISIVIIFFLTFGLFKWVTLGYSIQNEKITIKNYSFFQETIENIDKNKVINCISTKWFPSNLFGISDLRIQLEGEEEESTIFLPSILDKDRIRIIEILNVKKNETIDSTYKVTFKESFGGIISKGFVLSLTIIFLSTVLSSVSKTAIWENYFKLDFWITEMGDLPTSVYQYTFILLVISVIAQYSKAINFKLQISNDQVNITSGAFSKKVMNIYIQNIKGLVIHQTIIQRILKRSTIYIETIDKGQKGIILHPFVKNNDISKFVYIVYGEKINLEKKNWNSQGGKMIILIMYMLILSMIYFYFYFYLKKYLIITLIFFILLSSFQVFKHWNLKFRIENGKLLLQEGVFVKKTHILKDPNLNYISITKMPWQTSSKGNVKLGYFNNSVRKKMKIKAINIEVFSQFKSKLYSEEKSI